MNCTEIKAFLITVDPTIERYESSKKGDAYTVWYETRKPAVFADGQHEDITHFQIDRFTKTEDDSVAAAIFTALEGRDDISFDYLTDHEDDTGYIHHIFDCEAC